MLSAVVARSLSMVNELMSLTPPNQLELVAKAGLEQAVFIDFLPAIDYFLNLGIFVTPEIVQWFVYKNNPKAINILKKYAPNVLGQVESLVLPDVDPEPIGRPRYPESSSHRRRASQVGKRKPKPKPKRKPKKR
jgi:hypothetical protein